MQEVQLAFQKMDVYAGDSAAIYQSLAEAMGWLLTWLRGKADAGALPSKGYERFEGIWAGRQVCISSIPNCLKHHLLLMIARMFLHSI